jgi:hypothetical protein
MKHFLILMAFAVAFMSCLFVIIGGGLIAVTYYDPVMDIEQFHYGRIGILSACVAAVSLIASVYVVIAPAEKLR